MAGDVEIQMGVPTIVSGSRLVGSDLRAWHILKWGLSNFGNSAKSG